jgi:hypothetical protein
LDVTISHSLRMSSTIAARENVTFSADMAEKHKNQLYGPACHVAGWIFRPLAFETTGGIGPLATRFLRKLTRSLSMRSGKSPPEVATATARKINLALAKGCAEMLVGAHDLHANHGS